MQFPPLFAVAVPTAIATAPIHDNRFASHQHPNPQHQQPQPDRVSIYQATLIRDGPDRWGESPSIYLVAPYRIYHGTQDRQYPDDTYVSSGRRPPSWPRNDVMLLADATASAAAAASTGDTEIHRRVIYQGPWEQSGFTVFSMYCGSAIPVLEFPGSSPTWPPAYFNRLPLTPITQNQLRFWSHRWDPDTWPDTRGSGPIAMSGGGGGGGGAAPAARTPTPPPPPPPPPPQTTVPITTVLPLFVAELVIHDAHNRGLTCPITLEPISPTQRTPLAVTPCYHVFTASALEAWFSVGDPSCPVCKSRCPNTLS